MEIRTTLIDGQLVEAGDYVGFKCDIEQSGRIEKIVRGRHGVELHLVNEDGFEGGYIGGETTHIEEAERCWV